MGVGGLVSDATWRELQVTPTCAVPLLSSLDVAGFGGRQGNAQAAGGMPLGAMAAAGAQFTCFTGTKVRILTQVEGQVLWVLRPTRLRLLRVRYSVYLLYWYKSTNMTADELRLVRCSGCLVY